MTDKLPQLGLACAKLQWVDGNGTKGSRFLREGESVTIGRGQGNDVPLDSRRVSRRHVSVEWHNGKFYVVDQASTNGTKLNERMVVEPAELIDGDKLVMSNVEMTFHEVELGSISEEQVLASIEATLTPPTSGDEDDNGVEGDTARLGIDSATGMPMETLEEISQEKIVREPEPATMHEQIRMPRLLVTAGPDAGLDVRLNADSILIGRATPDLSYDISLRDRRVSRPHAQLERQTDSYLLTDLESTNGTYVNNKRLVGSIPLADGDTIAMGESTLVFRLYK